MEREHQEALQKKGISKPHQDLTATETHPITLIPCGHEPPFWWKREVSESDRRFRIDEKGGDVMPRPEKSEYKAAFLRWQEEPDVFDQNLTDPCKKRAEMALYVTVFYISFLLA